MCIAERIHPFSFFFKKILLSIFGPVAMSVLSLVSKSRGYSLVAVRRLLISVAPLVAEHRL